MKQLFLEQQNLNSRFTSILIFLFPIAGVGLRDWFSGFATLIMFSGVYLVIAAFRRRTLPFEGYSMEEKTLLILVSSLFFAFIISGFVNGWNDNQFDYFWGEMNFLFFIPIYFAVRCVKNAPEILVKGTVIAGIILIISYIYDVHISSTPYHKHLGAYGHLLSGPVSVIFMYVVISAYRELFDTNIWKTFFFVSVVFSFITALATKSSSAYALLLLMCFVVPFLIFKKFLSRLFFILFIILIFLLSYLYSSDAKRGVLVVKNGVSRALSIDDISLHKAPLGTASARVAMWDVSWKIFKDHPFVGVGRGNYTDAATVYYNKGIANAGVTIHSHPHSIYFELLASKGLLGLSIFIFIIFTIFRLYRYAYKSNLPYSGAALTHILAILFIGIGAADPILKNNFTAVFLVYLAVFYSSFSQQLKQQPK